LIATSKACKEVFNHGHFQNISNDWCVLHRLRRDGEELTEQIDQTVQLTNHPNDWPSYHDQQYTTEETNNAWSQMEGGKGKNDTKMNATCQLHTNPQA
jgi:hypothetical protein